MESKNDTTDAAVDVLMKNETIVDDVQPHTTFEKSNSPGKSKFQKIKIMEKRKAPLKPPLRCEPDSTTRSTCC
nr:hypothetical protein [Tanacetum cinerariifolium]